MVSRSLRFHPLLPSLAIIAVSFFSLLSISSLAIVSRLCFLSAIFATLIMVFFYFTKSAWRDLKPVFTSFTLFFAVYFFSLLYHGLEIPGLVKLLQILVSLCVICSGYLYAQRKSSADYKLLPAIALFALFILLISVPIDSKYGLFLNPNAFGMSVFILVVFCFFFFDKKVDKFAIHLGFLLIAYSGSRASMIGLIVMSFFYYLLPLVLRAKMYMITLILSSAFGIMAMLLVSGAIFPEIFDFLNTLSREYLGKNLNSGRGYVWPLVFDSVVQKNPFFGLGGGIELPDISEYNYSVHNVYLQVFMQTGLLGLFSLFILIISIWDCLFSAIETRYARVAAAAFLGLLWINLFEVTFFQNNLAFSLPILLIVGISLGDKRQRNFI